MLSKKLKDLASRAAIPSEEMTLRDYFAGQALQGMVASKNLWLAIAEAASEKKVDISVYFAQTSYQFADSMLKEREK